MIKLNGQNLKLNSNEEMYACWNCTEVRKFTLLNYEFKFNNQ